MLPMLHVAESILVENLKLKNSFKWILQIEF